jgi:hypothetical protein
MKRNFFVICFVVCLAILWRISRTSQLSRLASGNRVNISYILRGSQMFDLGQFEKVPL